MATIGENIKRLREEAGFATQLDFAKALDLPQSRVSELENDRYALPDTATLIKVAKTVGRSIDEILEGVDPGYDAVVVDSLARATDAVNIIRAIANSRIHEPSLDADNQLSDESRWRDIEAWRDRRISTLVRSLREDLKELDRTAPRDEVADGLTPEERQLVEMWRAVSDEAQRAALVGAFRAHAILARRAAELRSQLESTLEKRETEPEASAKSRNHR